MTPSPGLSTVEALSGDYAPWLDLAHVTLRVGHYDVLDDVTCRINLSGVTVLRGPNGAGKTTFLRSLLGLCMPMRGEIRLFGRTPTHCRSLLGYMPQKGDRAAPMLPVLSHVAACIDGAAWGFSWPGVRARQACALLRQTDALHLAARPLGVLSGGERQRVSLAQALSDAPRLLLLDEPLAGLDQEGRRRMLALLRRLRQVLKLSVLMTVHEDLSREELGDNAHELWLAHGQLCRGREGERR
ncbi:metal ABC transporter ATP-binding protein [Oecophyllibacter saccharovorans]|uniref:ATP-binding cassette domain-containing protein n=1 Tax=Oecophyllibacter saccharovorans TaxID=2558360 RepID=A0A506UKU3_9PROT|nr:ATP-binding cassette domain-containing protein [Oecophyllibacter saccharovorans]TPW33984.1 ATP-binding cassette domain-containing protein [Oecophyllibacter saccharovorans]